jgi:hypothetical protein
MMLSKGVANVPEVGDVDVEVRESFPALGQGPDGEADLHVVGGACRGQPFARPVARLGHVMRGGHQAGADIADVPVGMPSGGPEALAVLAIPKPGPSTH